MPVWADFFRVNQQPKSTIPPAAKEVNYILSEGIVDNEGTVIFSASSESSTSVRGSEDNAINYFKNWFHNSVGEESEYESFYIESPTSEKSIKSYDLYECDFVKSIAERRKYSNYSAYSNKKIDFHEIFHEVMIEIMRSSGGFQEPSRAGTRRWSLLPGHQFIKFHTAHALLESENIGAYLVGEYGNKFLKFLLGTLEFYGKEEREFFKVVMKKVKNNDIGCNAKSNFEKNAIELLESAVKSANIDFVDFFVEYAKIDLKKLQNSAPSFLRKLTENISKSDDAEKTRWRAVLKKIY